MGNSPPANLVTGGAGFIGSHLTESLLAAGQRVIVIDDESTGSFANLAAVANHPLLTCHRGNVGDADLLETALEGVEAVYHLAAAVGVELIARDPIDSIERNIQPTQILLDGLATRSRAGQPVKFFLASSSEVYGKNPKSTWREDDDLVFGPTQRSRWSYGAAKAIDEFLALAFWRKERLPVVIGRFFNVVGPRQSGAYGMVLPRFASAAAASQPLIVHDDGHQQRCFAHVSDVVAAVQALMATPQAAGRVYNIGSDEPIEIGELARRVVAAAGSASRIEHQSYTEAYDDDFEDVRRRVPDLTRLRETVDYRPQHTLDSIIAQVLAEARQQALPPTPR